MHITNMAQLYALQYGTVFSVANGAWDGRIVRKDGAKYLEIKPKDGYTYIKLLDEDIPNDLQLCNIGILHSKEYSVTALATIHGTTITITFSVRIDPALPAEEEAQAAEKEALKYLSDDSLGILPGTKFQLSVTSKSPSDGNR